ncbi:MAG: hypothetical protein ACKVH7_00010 [Alphaproteobacteria bacterium]
MNQSSLHRYDTRVLMGDYIRAGAGALICFAPVLLVEVVNVLVYILLSIGTVFTVFGLRTLIKQMTSIELSATGIRTLGPLARTIGWSELSGMKLAFYSMRRNRYGGTMDLSGSKSWMELKLRGTGNTITVDSSLDGFDSVVAVAMEAAQDRELPLNDVTLANLDAMGFAVGRGAMPDDHL